MAMEASNSAATIEKRVSVCAWVLPPRWIAADADAALFCTWVVVVGATGWWTVTCFCFGVIFGATAFTLCRVRAPVGRLRTCERALVVGRAVDGGRNGADWAGLTLPVCAVLGVDEDGVGIGVTLGA